MTKTTLPWLGALVLAAALLVVTRCDARRDGIYEAKIALLDSAIAADRKEMSARAEQLTRDSLARVEAERAAATARSLAAAQKARSDSLDARVQLLDSTRVLAAGDTVTLPPLVIRDIAQLRATVLAQAEALQADTLQIHRLESELATSRQETADARRLIGHQDEKAAVLEEARPSWWRRLGHAVVRVGTTAGCGAIGAAVAGVPGAAIGAGACTILSG